MRRSSRVRNYFCGLLALSLIACGRVRRARRRAFEGGAVTAIYFHNPNKDLFIRCIRWLVKRGYTFISVNELLQTLHHGKVLPRGAVWLSFDDGCKELLDDVLPLIRNHHIPVTLFIPTGIIAGDGLFPWLHQKSFSEPQGENGSVHGGVRNALTVAELKQVTAFPEVTIGSHTVSHAITTHLTEDKIGFELGESKRVLESWLQKDIKCFAYPVGRFDGREKRFLVEFGYTLAATTENAFITPKTDPYLVPRFSIGDEISFPEAVCNMVGVWRPAIDPIINFLRRLSRITRFLNDASGTKPSGSKLLTLLRLKGRLGG